MDTKLKTRLRSAIRLLWLRMGENRKYALKNARVERGKYKCAMCSKLFKREQINVDHIVPCGRFDNWNDFAMWVGNLFDYSCQILCEPCHKIKTNKDIKEMRK